MMTKREKRREEGKVFTLPHLNSLFLHIFSHDCAHVENIKSRNKFPSFFCCFSSLYEMMLCVERIDIESFFFGEVDEDENDEQQQHDRAEKMMMKSWNGRQN